jgi:hypothetical protein
MSEKFQEIERAMSPKAEIDSSTTSTTLATGSIEPVNVTKEKKSKSSKKSPVANDDNSAAEVKKLKKQLAKLEHDNKRYHETLLRAEKALMAKAAAPVSVKETVAVKKQVQEQEQSTIAPQTSTSTSNSTLHPMPLPLPHSPMPSVSGSGITPGALFDAKIVSFLINSGLVPPENIPTRRPSLDLKELTGSQGLSHGHSHSHSRDKRNHSHSKHSSKSGKDRTPPRNGNGLGVDLSNELNATDGGDSGYVSVEKIPSPIRKHRPGKSQSPPRNRTIDSSRLQEEIVAIAAANDDVEDNAAADTIMKENTETDAVVGVTDEKSNVNNIAVIEVNTEEIIEESDKNDESEEALTPKRNTNATAIATANTDIPIQKQIKKKKTVATPQATVTVITPTSHHSLDGNNSSFFHSDDAGDTPCREEEQEVDVELDDEDDEDDDSVDSAFGVSGVRKSKLVDKDALLKIQQQAQEHEDREREMIQSNAYEGSASDNDTYTESSDDGVYGGSQYSDEDSYDTLSGGSDNGSDHTILETFNDGMMIKRANFEGDTEMVMSSDLYVIILQEILELRATFMMHLHAKKF